MSAIWDTWPVWAAQRQFFGITDPQSWWSVDGLLMIDAEVTALSFGLRRIWRELIIAFGVILFPHVRIKLNMPSSELIPKPKLEGPPSPTLANHQCSLDRLVTRNCGWYVYWCTWGLRARLVIATLERGVWKVGRG